MQMKSAILSYCKIAIEIEIYKQELCRTPQFINVSDKVKTSLSDYPYTQHEKNIKGNMRNPEWDMLYNKIQEKKKVIDSVKMFVSNIDDIKRKRAIEIKYLHSGFELNETVTWKMVAAEMKMPSQTEAIKKDTERFLKNL